MGSKLPSEIWDQFVSGDHNKFCRLFKGYYRGLYGYGLKLSEDPDLVKDAIQNLNIPHFLMVRDLRAMLVSLYHWWNLHEEIPCWPFSRAISSSSVRSPRDCS